MSVGRIVLGSLISNNNIALDTSVNGGSASATSLTYSHTCTGVNSRLFVGVLASAQSVTGVTYAGIAMSQVASIRVPSSNWLYLFSLLSPTIGANNVIISASGSITITALSSSYNNCLQLPLDGSNTNSASGFASGADFSASITIIANTSWMVYLGGNTGSATPTAGSNSTLRQAVTSFGLFDSNNGLSPGAHSLASRVAGLENRACIVASFGSIITLNPTTRAVRTTFNSAVGLRTMAPK